MLREDVERRHATLQWLRIHTFVFVPQKSLRRPLYCHFHFFQTPLCIRVPLPYLHPVFISSLGKLTSSSRQSQGFSQHPPILECPLSLTLGLTSCTDIDRSLRSTHREEIYLWTQQPRCLRRRDLSYHLFTDSATPSFTHIYEASVQSSILLTEAMLPSGQAPRPPESACPYCRCYNLYKEAGFPRQAVDLWI